MANWRRLIDWRKTDLAKCTELAYTEAQQRHQNYARSLSNNELSTTVTELSAINPPANPGLSESPKAGRKTPAANGMQIRL